MKFQKNNLRKSAYDMAYLGKGENRSIKMQVKDSPYATRLINFLLIGIIDERGDKQLEQVRVMGGALFPGVWPLSPVLPGSRM